VKFITIILGYLKWHYGKALATTFAFWKNILVYLFNYFSLKNLIGNFFAPWKRLADSYPKQFNFKVYFGIFIVNTIMRIVGIIMRTIIIIIGLFVCVIYVVFLPASLLFWLALPVIIIWLIVYGLILIFFS